MERVKRRRYDSPLRRQQAETTMERIVTAARQLFASGGYAATTIDAIAERAGVARPTVYATFGSKRAMLLALVDRVEAEAELPALLLGLRAAEGHPRRQVGLLVEFNRRLFSRGLDVLEILRGAGSAEPDLAEVWREGERRRRQGQAPLVRAWSAAGALRTDLSVKAAADILWALTGPDVFRLVVVESGWSARRYAGWLVETLQSALFGQRPA